MGQLAFRKHLQRRGCSRACWFAAVPEVRSWQIAWMAMRGNRQLVPLLDIDVYASQCLQASV
jgi:hypothetical protein